MTLAPLVLAAANGAETAGLVIGQLLGLLIAVVLVVLGVRARRRPTLGNRVGGLVLIVLGGLMLLGGLASLTDAAT
ncbi:hypothetical protein [Modestobacter sp. Leaf380]|uniref:hypothetical protein n=1 Tax=Modestobacter sp. Leaf380 TaxID=1736356 RepID=UPI0012F8152D|nr:hypothetical protein [Modestobacter sp. Leaf380]